jgi:hypothetical protein
VSALSEHLRSPSNYWEFYTPTEINSAKRFIYTSLLEAVSVGADMLTLKRSYLEWSRNGTVLGRFPPIDFVEANPGYAANLKMMIELDIVLQRYLKILRETPEETAAVQILQDDQE